VEQGKEPVFELFLVGLQSEVHLLGGEMCIKPTYTLANTKDADLILIPAISGDIETAITLNAPFYPWLRAQYEKGAEIASLCIGAFLLAATGLLNGKACSTHWLHAAKFAELFPQVSVSSERVITMNNGLYSSGGATVYWNLLLYLAEKLSSREMAVLASKFFLLDLEKSSQLPFTIFQAQKKHGDTLILAAQQFLEEHFNDKLTIDTLAEKFGLGRRTFERRFRTATGNSVL
jgi:transcriptional regulator GlxA family with amidase domain